MVEIDRAIGDEMRNIAIKVQRLIDLEGLLANMRHDLVEAQKERDKLLNDLSPGIVLTIQEAAADRVHGKRISPQEFIHNGYNNG